MTYKELAGTFRQVAEGGAEVFYRGPIARAIARAVGEAGGWLTEADLAAFAPEWREPLAITYRGWEVSTVPPPFSAFQMLETLNILEGYDLGAWGHNSGGLSPPPDRGDQARSADRLAYAYSGETPTRGLVSKAYAASQRARIDPARAAVSEGERFDPDKLPGQIAEGHPAQFANEQTTHFACADASGTVVSVTQTLGMVFGSGFAVPGTGLVLNDILKWMDRDPASPNVLRPGKKAGTMMSPTQVFKDGAFALSIGTPGSYGILQTQPQMLLNVLEFGLNVQEAIEVPRVRDLPRSSGRRRGAHPRGDAPGARPARPSDQRHRRLVVGGGGRAGHRPRRRVGRAHGGRRPAARRLRAGDLRRAANEL